VDKRKARHPPIQDEPGSPHLGSPAVDGAALIHPTSIGLVLNARSLAIMRHWHKERFVKIKKLLTQK